MPLVKEFITSFPEKAILSTGYILLSYCKYELNIRFIKQLNTRNFGL